MRYFAFFLVLLLAPSIAAQPAATFGLGGQYLVGRPTGAQEAYGLRGGLERQRPYGSLGLTLSYGLTQQSTPPPDILVPPSAAPGDDFVLFGSREALHLVAVETPVLVDLRRYQSNRLAIGLTPTLGYAYRYARGSTGAQHPAHGFTIDMAPTLHLGVGLGERLVGTLDLYYRAVGVTQVWRRGLADAPPGEARREALASQGYNTTGPGLRVGFKVPLR